MRVPKEAMMTMQRPRLLIPFAIVAVALAAVSLSACAAGTEPAGAAQEADIVPAQPVDRFAASPYLRTLADSPIYDEIWERPQLSKRDRSMITIAVLQALGRDTALRSHLGRGLDNGLTPEEISEIILHVSFYTGWPSGLDASLGAIDTFAERGTMLGELPGAPPTSEVETPAGLSDAYAAVPRLGALRNSLLYGDVWERPLLSKRDRSLITVAVNQARYFTNELRLHIDRALDQNGVTPQELSEVVLHTTFYAGWPPAVNAGRLLTEALRSRGVDLAELQ